MLRKGPNSSPLTHLEALSKQEVKAKAELLAAWLSVERSLNIPTEYFAMTGDFGFRHLKKSVSSH